MPWAAMWNVEGKAPAVQKNSGLLSFVHLTYSNSSELFEEKNRSKCWQSTLHSSHWTDATEQVGPQEQKLLFLQSTHLSPILWISQLRSMILGLNIHIFPHSMMSKHKRKHYLKLSWRNDGWLDASRKAAWICWSYWGSPCPYIVHFDSFVEILRGIIY